MSIPSIIWDDTIIPISLEELRSASQTDTLERICQRINGRSGYSVSCKALASAFDQRGLEPPSVVRARRAGTTVANAGSTESESESERGNGSANDPLTCNEPGDTDCLHVEESVDTSSHRVDCSVACHVVKDTRPSKPSSVVVCPDVHAPYHDKRAWATFMAAASVLQPDTFVFIGDFVDCYAVSRFSKNPSRSSFLRTELDAANELLDEVQALGIGRVVFVEGNHEQRMADYIARQAKELYGMTSIREALRIEERGWEWVPYKRSIRIGRMHYTHDVDKWGKYAAQQSLEVYGGNLCFGHTHRAGVLYWGNARGEDHVVLNVGWLGDIDSVDYRHRDRARIESQHAFGLVLQEADGTVHAHAIPILDSNRCIVDGKLVVGGGKA